MVFLLIDNHGGDTCRDSVLHLVLEVERDESVGQGNVRDGFAHIFLPEERERYNLEELWADADIRQIPNLD